MQLVDKRSFIAIHIFNHLFCGPDPRELPPKAIRTQDVYVPDPHIDTIKVKTRDFR